MAEKGVARAARRSAVEALATAGERARESVAVARHAYGLVQALREGDGFKPVIELVQLAAQVHETSMDGYRQVSRDAARWEQRARSILAHHERAFNATGRENDDD